MFSWFKKKEPQSGNVAKERLKIVLVDDRANTSSEMLEQIKNDIFAAVSRHVDFDVNDLDIQIQRSRNGETPSNKYVLHANIPIKKIKK